MADNSRVTPMVLSLVKFTERQIDIAAQLLGRSLPCQVVAVVGNGQFVTVAFQVVTDGQTIPQVTIPVATSRYARAPIAVGDAGLAVPADARIGGVTGRGGGVADLSTPANLSALTFLPLANAAWPAQPANQYLITAPGGALIQDDTGASQITLTPTGITLKAGGVTMSITSAGIELDGIVWETHVHGGVMSGGGDTGPPL